jgi:putative tryptophan/tyrosine transport system substrate-binding protein
MNRRSFITLLGGAAAMWPLAARSQQPANPVIGFLHGESANTMRPHLAGFHRGLKEGGFVNGQNLTIDYRWAESRADRLPAMAADLVRRRVAVIIAGGGTRTAMAAKNATTTIPIVFATGGDPVGLGLVTSLARPSGNMTGVSFFNADLTAKGLGLLHQIAPKARVVALLFNPNVPDSARQPADTQEAARALGLELLVLNASTDTEIDSAFATLQQRGAGALVIGGDPFFRSRLDRLTALTERHRIPATYVGREFPAGGGLMSYGTSVMEAYRQIGIYGARILKGEKPQDLPVMLATKFEFVINLKTATAFGLDVPPGVSSMADEIIE